MGDIKGVYVEGKRIDEIEDCRSYLAWPEEKNANAEVEEKFSWVASVPAPIDADGNVVPLTTRVMYSDKGEKRNVFSFTYDARWSVNFIGIGAGAGYISNYHLHCPDSWERLEEDVRRAENSGTCGYFSKRINNLSCDGCPVKDAKIPCAASALRDVLHRAKVLAKRDAKMPIPQP